MNIIYDIHYAVKEEHVCVHLDSTNLTSAVDLQTFHACTYFSSLRPSNKLCKDLLTETLVHSKTQHFKLANIPGFTVYGGSTYHRFHIC